MVTSPAYKPGDLVTRTGETVRGIEKGATYPVKEVTPDGYLTFDGDDLVEFHPYKFRPAETEEAKS